MTDLAEPVAELVDVGTAIVGVFDEGLSALTQVLERQAVAAETLAREQAATTLTITGKDGLPGPQGRQGEIGKQGLRGDPGEVGADGPGGLDGRDGAKGDKGDRGERGLKGDPGRDGLDGKDGKEGPRGFAGLSGTPGGGGGVHLQRDGVKLAGSTLDLKGTGFTVTPEGRVVHIEVAGGAGGIGPAGPAGADGATGPAGPTGAAGADGADGATGATGPTGSQGPKGDTGSAGSPGLGSTATVRQAAGMPSGAPTGTELPIAFDTTATTGGLYVWSGAAWLLAAPIPPVITPG